ncbi:hypothetical protein [Methanobrevibacter smithii]|jgi:hypothetical protein|uniref:hypothetical protein n=1 Tax=Methanobrevibacter smithii TaxID=2173 RepID=UPI002046CC30|nr:MAG TPA: hypothetical protein [Caudoviricetes sp.]
MNIVDKEAIIYLAICNQINVYSVFLENKKDTLSEEDLQMTLYILNESEKLEKELRDKFEDIPIQRPKWNQK